MFPAFPPALRFLRRAGDNFSRPFNLSLTSVTVFRLLLAFAFLYDLLR